MKRRKVLFLFSFLVVTAFFFSMAAAIHPFGEPYISDMGRFLLEEAQLEADANNIVTAVVFDYRGFDTLGEATVLFTAVLAIAALFRRLAE